MKRIIICLLLLALPTISFSSEKSKRESVEELLSITDAESVLDKVYSQMDQMFQGMGKQLGVKPEEQETFHKFMSKMVSLMKEEMSWDKMKEPMVQIYMKHYSEKEIQDQIAFYKSESGQSIISKQPEVVKDTMMLTQEAFKNFIPKLQQISKELEKELAASRSYNSAAQAILRNATVAQEAYWVDHQSYTQSKDELFGKYGLQRLEKGFHLNIITAGKNNIEMEAFHDNGTEIYNIKGPGGIITSKPKAN